MFHRKAKAIEDILLNAVRRDLGQSKIFWGTKSDLIVTNVSYGGGKLTIDLESREALEARNRIMPGEYIAGAVAGAAAVANSPDRQHHG